MHQNLYKLTVPYRKEYGDGALLKIFYVKDGHVRDYQQKLMYAEPDKKLRLSWKTFRDRLYPGQDETWTLQVKDKDGRIVNDAEMMATLYDASLDEIKGNTWWVDIYFNRTVFYRVFNQTAANSLPYQSFYGELPSFNASSREFTSLSEYFQSIRLFSNGRLRGLASLKSVSIGASDESEGYEPREYEYNARAIDGDIEAAMNGSIGGNAEIKSLLSQLPSPISQPSIRTNFAETAFFYPHLTTNKKGELSVSFALPESLTKWKFMGLVHTKDMQYVTIIDTVMAQKDFMVQPNIPRFIREGDEASIQTRIINQTDRLVKGDAILRITDEESGKVVMQQTLPFSVDANKTASVLFPLSCTDALKHLELESSTLICEVSAVSGDRSDGERRYLNILPSKQHLTETVPFWIENKGTKTIDLHTLYNNSSTTATDKTVRVEYVDNPALLCIPALEMMQLPKYDNAPSLAASLYSNAMLQKLAAGIPDFREYNKTYNPDSVALNMETARTKLLKLQNHDGSWSWFEGMDGSYYITLSVCENLAMLLAQSQKAEQTLTADFAKAMDFLDQRELMEFKQLKKRKNASFVPSESTLHYLYIYTLTGRQMNGDLKKMRDAYLKALEKESKNLSIYGKANGSLLLRSFGREASAGKFLKSLLEYSVYKPGMGRYFDTRKAHYSWRDYKVPTQIAAMKAVKQGADNQQILNEMIVWLLRQKQVQEWDNPMNEVEVADMLLSESAYFTDGRTAVEAIPSLSIDGKKIEKGETVEVDAVSELQIEKSSDGISWGAVYGECNEHLSSIQSNGTGELTISCDIDGADSLKVGDKVKMRITVTADRDMDFVKVTCQHPGCFEPVNQLSGYRRVGQNFGYVSRHDSSTDIFFDSFRKGTHQMELEFYVDREGTYQSGISTVKCTYCPDFSAHSGSRDIIIRKVND